MLQKPNNIYIDNNTDFAIPDTREPLISGDKLSSLLGKIAKYTVDLKNIAFTGNYNDLDDTPDLTKILTENHNHSIDDIIDLPDWVKSTNKPDYNWDDILNKPDEISINIVYGNNYYMLGYDTPNGYLSKFKTRSFVKFNKENIIISSEYHNLENDTDTERISDVFVFHAESTPNEPGTSFRPAKDNIPTIGTNNYRWKDIYCVNSAISTSDKRLKTNISYMGDYSDYDTYIDDNTIYNFVMSLKPAIYNRIDGDSNRPHHGLIADDFELSLKKLNIPDHAAFIKSTNTDDTNFKGLRYEEILPDILRVVQIQDNKIKNLEDTINQIKRKSQEVS